MLSDTVPLVFGTPNATGFFMWGFWQPADVAPRPPARAAFYNDDWIADARARPRGRT